VRSAGSSVYNYANPVSRLACYYRLNVLSTHSLISLAVTCTSLSRFLRISTDGSSRRRVSVGNAGDNVTIRFVTDNDGRELFLRARCG
jgi:hypothetical protein